MPNLYANIDRLMRTVKQWFAATRYRHVTLLAHLLCALLWADSSYAQVPEPGRVLILMSQHSAPYEEVADELSKGITAVMPDTEIRRADNSELATQQGDAEIIVAVGSEAGELAAENAPQVPVLNMLVPQQMHQHLARRHQHRKAGHYSAIYLDQPPARQIDLIRLAFPDRKSIGVLAGPASVFVVPGLQAACVSRDVDLIVAKAQGPAELAAALRQLTQEADVLLALADPAIQNSGTVRNILISAYRASLPVVAFSPSYVAAGAVLALYSTPRQMGRQGADAILQWLRDRSLPPPQYPSEFEIAINENVARSLNLVIDPVSTLTDKMRRAKP
ncbi:MAG: ABC transporter substrate binding protein [Gallionella sp.]